MAVDYISTAPWNDPYNPWPVYNSCVVSFLSSGVAFTKTLNMYAFDPYATDDVYAGYESDVPAWPVVKLEYYKDVNNFWQLGMTNSNVYLQNYYRLFTDTRSLPNKQTGSAYAWTPVATDGNISISSVSIQSVMSDWTPWEYRRRRLLEYI